MFSLPFLQSYLIFRLALGIVVVNPSFIYSDHSLPLPVIWIMKFLQDSIKQRQNPICSCVSKWGTHMEHICFILSSSVSIWFMDILIQKPPVFNPMPKSLSYKGVRGMCGGRCPSNQKIFTTPWMLVRSTFQRSVFLRSWNFPPRMLFPPLFAEKGENLNYITFW